MSKYYAVKKGLVPGVYTTWEECESNVKGYPGALYKSFSTEAEAKAYLADSVIEIKKENNIDLPNIYAFVDGSFNATTGVYGYGGFIIANGEKYTLTGNGSEEEMREMRNVAGEILGAMAAVEKAVALGLSEITIFYDYQGIESWANGDWKRNKTGTKVYYEFIQSSKDMINIKFVKVKGHTGIPGNEEADKLAKQSVGIL